ncbi:ABC transporter ATP-binding protein [Paenibacillus sp. TRM 82003]|nr:ABC transporter ATP-binding protein [Paenibacillus sp. TRM 82003]
MIRVNDLSFTYPGARFATLEGVTFKAGRGEIIGFLGPSGAGKTTLQNILIGLLRGYDGSVRLFDRELSGMGRDVYERIGVAFEFPNFYQRLTALENLKFFQSLYREPGASPESLLASVGLQDDANKRVSSFSKGMRMRLNFCRALLNDPELVLLDEPTSGLDPVSGRRMREKILELRRSGKTVLLTTHHMALAEELCDRVAFLADGTIRLIGEPKKLKVERGSKRVRVEYESEGALAVDEFELSSLGENDRFATLLVSKRIVTMHTTEATLEDVFLEATGRRLEA